MTWDRQGQPGGSTGGGLAWEDGRSSTLAEAVAGLEKGLTKWYKEQVIEIDGG